MMTFGIVQLIYLLNVSLNSSDQLWPDYKDVGLISVFSFDIFP